MSTEPGQLQNASITLYHTYDNGDVPAHITINDITHALRGGEPIAADHTGRIFVASNDKVLIFDGGSNGDAIPKVISGGLTGISGAQGITVGRYDTPSTPAMTIRRAPLLVQPLPRQTLPVPGRPQRK